MFYFKRLWMMVIVLAVALSACSDPDVKKVSFLEKGQKLYEQEDYVKARLEFKNSIQMDLKYADAYLMLGKTEFKLKSFKKAYGAYLKATELDPDNLEAQVELGKLLVVGRAYDKAADVAEIIFQKDPQNVDGILIKAKLLLEKKEFENAKNILNKLLLTNSNRAEPYLLLAAIEAKKKRVQSAEEVIRLGLEKFPAEIKLYLMLTELYVKTGRPTEAVDSLRQIVKLDSTNTSYQLTLGGLLWRIGKKQEAEEIFAKLKQDPENGEDNSVNIARFYISKKEFKTAEQSLLAVIANWPDGFAARYVLAEFYAGTSRTAKGIELLEAALPQVKDAAHPDSIKSKNILARMYLSGGNLLSAEKYVQQVIDASPNNIEGHFIKGSILLLKNDGEGAISDFRTVVNEKPEFPAGYIKLAEAYVLSGQKGLAFDILQNALDDMPDSKKLLKALAKLNIFDKNYVEAEKILRKIVEIDPGDLQARVALGDFFAGLKRVSEAEKQYKLIKEDVPQNPLSYLRLGRLYAAGGKPAKALAQLKDGFSAAPQSNALLNALVQVALLNKDFSIAEQACRSRLQKSQTDIYALNLLGKVLYAKKDYAQAERQFEKAIKIQPLWPEPHSNLAKLYLIQGKKDEAIAKFEANVKRDPAQMANYLFLGIIYEQANMVNQAIDIYEKALAEKPSFWVAANNLAFLLAEHKKSELDRALELALQAIKLRPEGAEIMDTVGWVYFNRGEMAEARTYIKKALDKSPESSILNYHMAVIYKTDGRKELAIEHLQKVLAGEDAFKDRQKAEKLLAELVN